MKPMYQRKRGLLRVAAIGQVIIMAGAGCKSSSPKESTGINDVEVSQALVGKDSSRTVTAANTVVNGYAALAANVAANATSITVTDIADFTSGTPPRPALAVGDLVLIIQMAGATINENDEAAFGTVTNLNNAGRYEFAGVTDISANTIYLGCGLKNAYSRDGKTQVVRVPQYTNLTINSGASITADAWNGTVGGVVAVHAMNTITVTGAITATGKGFRGGVARNGANDATTNVANYRLSSDQLGALKGEGIAGDPTSFTNPYGRGAPANAGGGGNLHNSGGGGGANASAADPATWNGQGVMLSDAAGVEGGDLAWTLDPGYELATPHARTNSPGGGRGGYTYSNSDQNATTLGPAQTAWDGNERREHGGLGGHPLTSSRDGRLFMGGGGGAGDGNDGQPVSGGNGGGLVFLIAGTVTGAGTISADGAHGGDSGSTNATTHADGAGGGGGGGTIVVHAGVLSLVHITANGGSGGDQTFTGTGGTEAEGPGGGGGGGFIALSGGTPASVAANGALGGKTNSSALTEFPTNGATAGQSGIANASAASLMYCTDHAAPDAIIITKPSNPSNSATATFTFGATEANNGVDAGDSAASFVCSLDGAEPFTPCPPTYIVSGLSDGWHTMRVRVVDLSGNDAGVGSEDLYRWRVDIIAPVPWILSGPGGSTSGGTSNSTTADFTFNATERDGGVETITFLCRLDSDTAAFVLCNNTGTSTPTFTGLAEGPHTLDVRARDDASDAGNVSSSTVRWSWTVHSLDAGDDSDDDDAGDARPADAALVDALLFADAADAEEGMDTPGTVVLDAQADTARDTFRAVDTGRDTSVSLRDVGDDSGNEAGVFWLDAAGDATDAGDAGPSSDSGAKLDASLPRDTAVVPTPDAYVAAPDASVSAPGKKDAADVVETSNQVKLMGGGFCSLNPSGTGTPGLATLFLVAAFGLLIVRRRRR